MNVELKFSLLVGWALGVSLGGLSLGGGIGWDVPALVPGTSREASVLPIRPPRSDFLSLVLIFCM